MDYVPEKDFNLVKNKKYLLITKSPKDKSLLKIFDKSFNYIILSDQSRRWSLFKDDANTSGSYPGSPLPYYLKGIFMNTSSIQYEKFNFKLEKFQKKIKKMY